MFDPLDLTPLSLYEMAEWVGLEGMCNRCKRLFIVKAPDMDGQCPEVDCGGWVRVSWRLWTVAQEADMWEKHIEHCKNPLG